jgi:hypothetical protein
MVTSTFEFGDQQKHSMEIRWSALGFEEYILDGVLVEKRWGFAFSGERNFMVDGAQIRISYQLGWRDFSSQAYINDVLYVEELFPDIAKKTNKARKKTSLRSFVISVIVWMIIGYVGMYAYRAYQLEQHKSRIDCSKLPPNANNGQPCP